MTEQPTAAEKVYYRRRNEFYALLNQAKHYRDLAADPALPMVLRAWYATRAGWYRDRARFYRRVLMGELENG